jgi:hypothetical protein
MNTPRLPESSEKKNKLIIRSEVLAVIRHLISLVDPSKQERLKQLKRLHDLNSPEEVQDVLVKELHRCASSKTLHIITEFLMELGDIDYLQEKLWNIIRDNKATDEVKDASNLVLRHLGDPTDPDLYLEYLEDPQGLIGRETIRMLEVSSENPEALIDFIDFILSLTPEDQLRLITSLQRDYPTEYLVNIYVPLLESDPSPELWEQLITNLGETRSAQASEVLHRLSQWPEDRLPVPMKLIQTSLKKLQLSGAYHPENPEQDFLHPETPHPLVKDTLLYQCYATVSDGIGNQGLLFSRQRPNGDITMLSVALNDIHGIIDCFGFFQLSVGDFHKIMEKFHEGATKIKVTPEYCVHKLLLAESMNQKRAFRLPYEYRCWRPMLESIDSMPPTEMDIQTDWVRKEWFTETNNLYQHPDFNSWFLEQGDEPCVTRWLQNVVLLTEEILGEETSNLEPYFTQLEKIADSLVIELLETPWRKLIQNRLTEAAYLLHMQNTNTFRNLAATEVHKLNSVTDPDLLLPGFVQAYGRRCVAEELLRLRMGSATYDKLTPIVDALMDHWKL